MWFILFRFFLKQKTSNPSDHVLIKIKVRCTDTKKQTYSPISGFTKCKFRNPHRNPRVNIAVWFCCKLPSNLECFLICYGDYSLLRSGPQPCLTPSCANQYLLFFLRQPKILPVIIWIMDMQLNLNNFRLHINFFAMLRNHTVSFLR